MNAAGLLAHEAWLEQDFWAAETLRSNGDDVAIRQFVSLLLVTALRCSLHLAVKVQGDVAKFLLEIDGFVAPLKLQKKCSGNHNIRRVVHIVHQHLSSACFISMCHPDSNHDLSFKFLCTLIYINATMVLAGGSIPLSYIVTYTSHPLVYYL